MHKEEVKDAMLHAKGHVPGSVAHNQHKLERGKSDTTGAGTHASNKAIAAHALKHQVKSLIPGTVEHDSKKSRE